MIRTLSLSAAVLLMATAASAQDYAPNFSTGQWRADMTMSANGQTMTDTTNDCMGAAEARETFRDLAKRFSEGAKCTSSSLVSQSPTAATFTMSGCSGGIDSGRMTITKTSDTSFTMNGSMTASNGLIMSMSANSYRTSPTCMSN